MKIEDDELERRLARFSTVAKQAGIKLTHQRLEIFRAVASSADHPSAEMVHRMVRRSMPTVSLDTVYRTLWMLMDLGLLSTLSPRQDSVRFDANLDQHHHYRCLRCGLVRDFDSAELDAMTVPDTVYNFGKVASAHVEVRGVCAACAKELAEEQTPSPPDRN